MFRGWTINMPLVQNMPGFWTNQGSEYTNVLNTRLVLNFPGFWIRVWFWIWQRFEYVKDTQGSEYTWICLDMSEYAVICVNMPKSAWMDFALYFPIGILCLLEDLVNYFNVYTKLEVLVWMKTRLLYWRDTIWFSSCKNFTCLFFRLNISTSKISNLLLPLGIEGVGACQ